MIFDDIIWITALSLKAVLFFLGLFADIFYTIDIRLLVELIGNSQNSVCTCVCVTERQRQRKNVVQ